MTTMTKEALWVTSGDTGWRAWVQAWYDALSGVGLTQTSDTGQMAVSPVTATYPGSNTYSGYWIFRFNDSMQSSAPIFIRIELGRGNGTSNGRIKVTTGTGTDGAGNITGVVRAAVEHSTTGWSPGTTDNSIIQMCYNTSVGVFWMCVNGQLSSVSGVWMAIARTIDTDGTPNAHGWATSVHFAGATQAHSMREVSNALTRNPIGMFTIPAGVGNSTQGLASGGYAPIWPYVGWANNTVYQLGGLYGCNKGDFAHNSEWTYSQFGTSRTYRGIAAFNAYPYANDLGLQNNAGVLALWE